jgi:hypothetical protein
MKPKQPKRNESQNTKMKLKQKTKKETKAKRVSPKTKAKQTKRKPAYQTKANICTTASKEKNEQIQKRMG